jgi:DNA polymerase III subunit chi
MHIEFYVFERANQQEARIALCQLIETWYQNGWHIAILCASIQEIQLLDHLLWTFSDTSFIPHNIATDAELKSPVRLFLNSTDIKDEVPVIVNLSTQALTTLTPSHLLVEIVFSDETVQQLARGRYKQYRDHGYQLKTIKMPLVLSK